MQTNVTATVLDANGIPYAGGTYSVQLIPTGTNPTVNGNSIGGAFNGSLDANGRFNISLWPNASIVPAATTWQFTICSNSGGIAPPLGTGTQCTPPTIVTIAGASQNLSSTLSAVAPKLTNFLSTGGVTSITATSPITVTPNPITGVGDVECPTCNTGTGSITACTVTGGVLYQDGTSNEATCGANLTSDSAGDLIGSGSVLVDTTGVPGNVSGSFSSEADGSNPVLEASCVAPGPVGCSAFISLASDTGSSGITTLNAVIGQTVHESTGALPIAVSFYEIASNNIGSGQLTDSYGFYSGKPQFGSGTPVTLRDAIWIDDQCTSAGFTQSTACDGIHILNQTSPGYAIRTGTGLVSFGDAVSMTKCSAGCILVASLTTTAATSDNVTVTDMTASGHCSLTPTNATAIGLITLPYISAKNTNQITVTHAVTAGATFDILCTPY